MGGGLVRFVAEACWMGPWLWRWLSLLWAACFFVLKSNVSLDLVSFLWLACSALLLAFVWLVELLCWLVRRRRGRTTRATRRVLVGWWSLPGLAVLLVVLALAGLPLRARFALSEGALARHAARVRAAGGSRDDVRVGLFTVLEAEEREGRVYLVTIRPFLDSVGFVHAPHGVPEEDHPFLYGRRVAEHWWTFSRDDF